MNCPKCSNEITEPSKCCAECGEELFPSILLDAETEDLLLQARKAIEERRLDDASGILTGIGDNDKNNPRVIAVRALVLRRSKRWEEAQELLEKALMDYPCDLLLHYNLSQVYSGKRKRNVAKQEYAKVLEIAQLRDPDQVEEGEAYAIGWCLFQSRQGRQAVAYGQQFLTIYPDSSALHYLLSVAYVARLHWVKAARESRNLSVWQKRILRRIAFITGLVLFAIWLPLIALVAIFLLAFKYQWLFILFFVLVVALVAFSVRVSKRSGARPAPRVIPMPGGAVQPKVGLSKKRLLIWVVAVAAGILLFSIVATFVVRHNNPFFTRHTSPVAEFQIPTPNCNPQGITAGPDGNIWFVEQIGQIGRITTSGKITEYKIPGSNHVPQNIAAGPDGNLWFTEFNDGNLGRITPSGKITKYVTPTRGCNLDSITAGPDGNMWFVEGMRGKIGKITPSGEITEYEVFNPYCITAGPDGNLWFASQSGIGKMNPSSGEVSLYALGRHSGFPQCITAGPGGNLWFFEESLMGRKSKIGKITTSGKITEYPVFGDSSIHDITAGPDGNVWFTDSDGDNVCKITPSGRMTRYPVPDDGGSPYGITAGPDGNMWFTNFGTIYHVDSSGEKTPGLNTIGRMTVGVKK